MLTGHAGYLCLGSFSGVWIFFFHFRELYLVFTEWVATSVRRVNKKRNFLGLGGSVVLSLGSTDFAVRFDIVIISLYFCTLMAIVSHRIILQLIQCRTTLLIAIVK